MLALQSTRNKEHIQDVQSAGQGGIWGSVCLSSPSDGENVRLQKIGEEKNQETEGRSHGTQRETNSTESQFQICGKLRCLIDPRFDLLRIFQSGYVNRLMYLLFIS